MKRHIQHFNASVAMVAALLSAVGCTVKPPQITPTATPTEYIFAQSGDTLLVEASGWWEFFGDTTLNRLVERAVENNPDIVVAASKVV
ncbi:MAG: TolC family protein, partial [Alistipes sp.]|nr:TolC family protein [Alistipes sp.]